MKTNPTPLTLALTAAFSMTGIAHAASDNPFALKSLQHGYMVAADDSNAAKAKEGKCGEGKCGASKNAKAKDGKCGAGKNAKAKDGKCGEGKCGAGKK